MTQKSAFVTASGLMSIMASFIAAIWGVIAIYYGIVASGYVGYPSIVVAGIGTIAVLAFAFALTGGILALRKSHLELVISGFALLILEAVLPVFIPHTGIVVFLVFGILVIVLSIAGIAFAVIGRTEFR